MPLTTRAAVQVGYSFSDIIDLDDLRKLPYEFINTLKPKNIIVRLPKKPPPEASPTAHSLRARAHPPPEASSDRSLSALAGEGLSDMDAQG